MSATTLDQLQSNQKACISNVNGTDGVTVRLAEMGLLAGEAIERLGQAPLGDPIQFYVRGGRLALRASEARRIDIELR
ncbi:ferrous iron transport protein A [bacterium]|nr:ferrous iron transport protein A [bacterium]